MRPTVPGARRWRYWVRCPRSHLRRRCTECWGHHTG
jgi:hypothetical protein